MAELRVYPERPLIEMFLVGYEQGVWKDAKRNWVEETQENAVEVIATRDDGKTLALEHTLIELFVGEKYDSTIFTEAFEPRIEKNPEFIIPGRALNVMIPVGVLVGIKDRDAAGEALLTWMRANHGSIPSGDSEQTITVGGSASLKVKFSSDDSGGTEGYCWLARCDKPGDLDKITYFRATQDYFIELIARTGEAFGDLTIRERLHEGETQESGDATLTQTDEKASAEQKALVELILDAEVEAMTRRQRLRLVRMFAAYLEIDPKDIVTVRIERANSIRVVMALPTTAAQKLVNVGIEKRDPRLQEILASYPFPILSAASVPGTFTLWHQIAAFLLNTRDTPRSDSQAPPIQEEKFEARTGQTAEGEERTTDREAELAMEQQAAAELEIAFLRRRDALNVAMKGLTVEFERVLRNLHDQRSRAVAAERELADRIAAVMNTRARLELLTQRELERATGKAGSDLRVILHDFEEWQSLIEQLNKKLDEPLP